MPSAPGIRLELRASRTSWWLGAAIVAISAIALALAPWSPWLRMLALVLYATGLLLGGRLLRRRVQPAWIEWRADGIWFLGASGRPEPDRAALRASREFGPLIRLDFRIGDSRHAITLWPDSADGDALRRLRIRLLREGNPATVSPSADVVR